MNEFQELFTEEYQYNYAIAAIKKLVEAGDKHTRNRLRSLANNCPDKWLELLKREFQDWTNPEKPEFLLRDGSPFLGNIPTDVEEDDIPF